MTLEKAQDLAVGAMVRCPEDRGDKAYSGRVAHIGTHVKNTMHGTDYIWVTVQHPDGHKSVWPSNRLG